MLALYSRRYVILKRVSGDATSAVCRLRNHASEALHAIPKLFINTRNAGTQRNAMKQTLLLNQIHVVEVREAVWYKTFVRTKIYSCNAILFVGRSVCVAQYQSLYDATIPC